MNNKKEGNKKNSKKEMRNKGKSKKRQSIMTSKAMETNSTLSI